MQLWIPPPILNDNLAYFNVKKFWIDSILAGALQIYRLMS